ncbi:MAG: hypothetical protein NHB14_01595 [Desulfosporosinus sp.]|nr:hypothetical protein [Desulfosporosinus sp.]
MEFINFLSAFFVVVFLFHLLWKYIILFPITLIVVLLKLPEKLGSYVLRSVELYFVAALTGLVTLMSIETFNSLGSKIAIAAIGTFLIFFYYLSSASQKEKQARQEFDFKVLAGIKFDYIIAYLAAPAFLLILFVPKLAVIAPVIYFLQAFDWIFHIHSIVKWGLSIFGLIMALSWMLNGAMYLILLIGSLFSKQTIGETKSEDLPMV